MLLESVADPDRDDIATIYHNLGGIEHARGDYTAGEPFARRGLAIRMSLPGAHSHALAADQVALAAILDGLEQHEEAERLYLEALEVFEREADAREIAVTLNDLGAQYAELGRLEQAADLLERAADLKRHALGPRHPDVAVTLNNLATTWRRHGDGTATAHAPRHPTRRRWGSSRNRSGRITPRPAPAGPMRPGARVSS